MISDAVQATYQAQDALQAELRRRYEWARWLAATDEALDQLEMLNLRDVAELPLSVKAWLTESFWSLPDTYRNLLTLDSTQKAIDSVFEMQERLFELRHPGRARDDECDEAMPDGLRERLLARFAATPEGLTATQIVSSLNGGMAEAARALLAELVAEGLLRWELGPRGKGGPRPRRYFLAVPDD